MSRGGDKGNGGKQGERWFLVREGSLRGRTSAGMARDGRLNKTDTSPLVKGFSVLVTFLLPHSPRLVGIKGHLPNVLQPTRCIRKKKQTALQTLLDRWLFFLFQTKVLSFLRMLSCCNTVLTVIRVESKPSDWATTKNRPIRATREGFIDRI